MGLAGRLQAIQQQNPSLAAPANAYGAAPAPAAAPAPGASAPSTYNALAAASSGSPFAAPAPSASWSAPAPTAPPSYAPSSYAPHNANAAPAYTGAPPNAAWASQAGADAKLQAQGAVGPTGAINAESLLHYLGDIVTKQGWQTSFWPPQKLREHCEQLVAKDHVSALDMRESCPAQPLGLFCASLFDLMVLGDDSGSMRGDSKTGRIDNNERWKELGQRFDTISGVGSIFDSNGIDIYFLNETRTYNSVTAGSEQLQQLQAWMAGHKCSRSTPTGPALSQRVLRDIRGAVDANYLSKPVMVYIITDGEPDDRRAVSDAIGRFSDELASKGLPRNAVLYSFSQVGNDRTARDYLSSLDDDDRIGPFVDATSSFELEAEEWARNGRKMTEDDYLMKTLIGAADPNFDRQDDGQRKRSGLRRMFH